MEDKQANSFISSDLSESDKSEEKKIINEQCYKIIYQNVVNFRDNWMNEMKKFNWGMNVAQEDPEEKRLIMDICEFIVTSQEILVELIIERNIDFTAGYTSLVDAIADVRDPNSLMISLMERIHKKPLDSSFFLEFNKRVSDGKFKRVIRKCNDFPRIYYHKDNKDIFSRPIFRVYKKRLILENLEYRIGLGLEQILGGRCVEINCEDALFGEQPVFIAIKESIGYNFETKRFFIKPDTKIEEIIGRVVVDEIPFMTTDNKLWLKYYRA